VNLLTANLTARESEAVFWLQEALRCVGRPASDVTKDEYGDGLRVDDLLLYDSGDGLWALGRLVTYPGTFSDPPDTDVQEFGEHRTATEAALAVVLQTVTDRYAAAQDYYGELAAERSADEAWDAMREWPVENVDVDALLAGAEDDADLLAERNRAVLRRNNL
jgi:hypothetical protein